MARKKHNQKDYTKVQMTDYLFKNKTNRYGLPVGLTPAKLQKLKVSVTTRLHADLQSIDKIRQTQKAYNSMIRRANATANNPDNTYSKRMIRKSFTGTDNFAKDKLGFGVIHTTKTGKQQMYFNVKKPDGFKKMLDAEVKVKLAEATSSQSFYSKISKMATERAALLGAKRIEKFLSVPLNMAKIDELTGGNYSHMTFPELLKISSFGSEANYLNYKEQSADAIRQFWNRYSYDENEQPLSPEAIAELKAKNKKKK